MRGKLSAEDWKAYDAMRKKARDSRRARDADNDEQSTLYGTGRANALDSRGGMSMYTAAVAVEDRVMRRLRDLAQARRECGMAFDGGSAEEVYRAALEARGVSRGESAGLSTSAFEDHPQEHIVAVVSLSPARDGVRFRGDRKARRNSRRRSDAGRPERLIKKLSGSSELG